MILIHIRQIFPYLRLWLCFIITIIFIITRNISNQPKRMSSKATSCLELGTKVVMDAAENILYLYLPGISYLCVWVSFVCISEGNEEFFLFWHLYFLHVWTKLFSSRRFRLGKYTAFHRESESDLKNVRFPDPESEI